MKENRIKEISFKFAIRIVKLSQYLVSTKNEYVLSKQILRSGTSVGAIIRETEHAESTPDFLHKLAIAQKEINETIYWIDLLNSTEYLTLEEHKSIYTDAREIYGTITKIIKTTKSRIHHPTNPNPNPKI